MITKFMKHPINLRDYPEIKPIMELHGCGGYGIFLSLVLAIKQRDPERVPLPLEPFIAAVARDCKASVELVDAVIVTCIQYGALAIDKQHLVCKILETAWVED